MMFLKYCIIFLVLLSSIPKNEACTGIIHKAENGDFIYARTLEFGRDLTTFDLLFVPRNMTNKSLSNDAHPSQWKNKYAYVGFNPFGLEVVADGLNEKGLACGAFYFPGWAQYEESNQNDKVIISNLDFVSWVLGNFSNVEDVLEALKTTTVTKYVYPAWNSVPPLHYIIVDTQGNKAVVEYIKGERKIYSVPLDTITNSPNYEWHEVNARNYIGLKALNKPSIKINGEELAAFGQGSGAIGLPGDFSPPSRFIRATFLNQVALQAKNGTTGIQRAFKILNQFDIPKGVVKEMEGGKNIYEETQWTSAADLSNRRYFFHTMDNSMIKFISFKDLDLNGRKTQSIPINGKETFVNITKEFKL